jgi:hypothetical protein
MTNDSGGNEIKDRMFQLDRSEDVSRGTKLLQHLTIQILLPISLLAFPRTVAGSTPAVCHYQRI